MALKQQGAFPYVNGGVISTIIPASGTESAVFECGNFQTGALIIPSVFTSADLTFKSSLTGAPGTFKNLKINLGNGTTELYKIAAVANDQLALDLAVFAFCPFLQIISAPAQAVAAEITIILAPIFNNLF